MSEELLQSLGMTADGDWQKKLALALGIGTAGALGGAALQHILRAQRHSRAAEGVRRVADRLGEKTQKHKESARAIQREADVALDPERSGQYLPAADRQLAKATAARRAQTTVHSIEYEQQEHARRNKFLAALAAFMGAGAGGGALGWQYLGGGGEEADELPAELLPPPWEEGVPPGMSMTPRGLQVMPEYGWRKPWGVGPTGGSDWSQLLHPREIQ